MEVDTNGDDTPAEKSLVSSTAAPPPPLLKPSQTASSQKPQLQQ